jgi:3-sulfinopropanoyl-CoA desulfinase
MDMKLSPEQTKLRSAARELAEAEFAARAAEIDRTEAYPFDNVAALKAAGFMGYTIPKSYGGRGGSYFEAALIIEEMARVCGATGRITVEANMGAISAVSMAPKSRSGSEPISFCRATSRRSASPSRKPDRQRPR